MTVGHAIFLDSFKTVGFPGLPFTPYPLNIEVAGPPVIALATSPAPQTPFRSRALPNIWIGVIPGNL